jgi:hypothetical protein
MGKPGYFDDDDDEDEKKKPAEDHPPEDDSDEDEESCGDPATLLGRLSRAVRALRNTAHRVSGRNAESKRR